MENDYQVAWVQNTSDSAVVPAGRATHNAMRWRPTRGIVNFVFSGIMAGGSQVHSFIGGGINNTVSAACSAILGGANNNVTHTFAGVFGNGINTVANGHFHINNLWMAPATYNTFVGIAPLGTFPLGTVYVDMTPGLGKPLRIQ